MLILSLINQEIMDNEILVDIIYTNPKNFKILESQVRINSRLNKYQY